MSLLPLPDLLKIEDYNGDYHLYQKAVHQEFLERIVGKLTFLGIPVSCKYFEPINGMHRSFWHLITENPEHSMDDEDRLLDFRRCERIRWISHIINNCNDLSISCWENKRGSNTNVVIWLQSEEYMIILSKRKGYYMLTTAYTHEEKTSKRNIKEMRRSKDPRKN